MPRLSLLLFFSLICECRELAMGFQVGSKASCLKLIRSVGDAGQALQPFAFEPGEIVHLDDPFSRDPVAATISTTRSTHEDHKAIGNKRLISLGSSASGQSAPSLPSFSERGPMRFFLLSTPDGKTQAARVLKIQPLRRGGTQILCELVDDEPKNSVRHRYVFYLSETDFSRIQNQEVDRQSAEEAFVDSLTQWELQTQRVAARLGVSIAYYQSWHGLADDAGLSAMMNLTLHLGIRHQFEKTFGPLNEKYLFESEKKIEGESRGYWNIFDVFGRMSPRFIMENFVRHSSRYSFAWVITEDGRLKIAPHGVENGFPFHFRLAHGRGVYAAGILMNTEEGVVVDNTFSQDYPYQRAPIEFIRFVFQTQAGVTPKDFSGTQNHDIYTEVEPKTGWNPTSSSPPMDFKEWSLKLGTASSPEHQLSAELRWANYVLGVSPSDTREKVRARYRLLIKEFQPRTAEESANHGKRTRTAQRINDAWGIIDKYFLGN